MAAEIVRFDCPLPPKELSPNARAHWRLKNEAKQAYAETVWIRGRREAAYDMPSVPWSWAAVHLIKHSTHETDQDNIIAACKVLIDTCSSKGTRPLGIFEDDKRIAVTAEWKRERVRAKGRIEVVITRREPPPEQRFEAHNHGSMRHEHFQSGEHDHR